MSTKIDLAGKRFGKLMVVMDSGRRSKRREVMWTCLCDCGKNTIVEGYELRRGHTRSCGCFRLQAQNYAGKRYGLLTVIRNYETGKRGGVTVECICDCGNIFVVSANAVVSGRRKSCGCAIYSPLSKFSEKEIRSRKRKHHRREDEKAIANLSDRYVKARIRKTYKLTNKNISPELVELKREQLTMYRQLKELKNGLA